jgi:hypothetical protein
MLTHQALEMLKRRTGFGITPYCEKNLSIPVVSLQLGKFALAQDCVRALGPKHKGGFLAGVA